MPKPASFAARLLAWFDTHGRKHLPWQKAISPYRVWVSEIMLQQTQVGTVVDYYIRFMGRFPTVETLAAATEDEVLHLWTGLGYYSRARNLLKTARHIVNQGGFPKHVSSLEALPGIGRSTAGAIASIAMGQRAPILDGNVKRVLARHAGIEGYPGTSETAKALWSVAEEHTPATRFDAYTQAIMDLGATLCTRVRPACSFCPVSDDCNARLTGRVDTLPGKKPKKLLPQRSTTMLLIEDARRHVLLQRRPGSGIWGGLWSFPECARDHLETKLDELLPGLRPASMKTLAPIRHGFTHYRLTIEPVHVKLHVTVDAVAEPGDNGWFSLDEPMQVGQPRPVTRLIETLRTD